MVFIFFIFLLSCWISLCLAKINNIVVFGDSYSDLGNRQLSSNGPLWSQHLAIGWNASLYSFAFSGATCDQSLYQQSNNTTAPSSPSIVDQLEIYYQQQLNLKPEDTIYAFWVGYNDIYNMLQTNDQNYDQLTDCIIQQMHNVRKVFGTNRFLMFTLVPMDKMPYFNKDNDKIALQRQKQAIDNFNQLLHEKVSNLVKHHQSLELDLVDAHDLLKDMVNNPDEFGFKDGQHSFWDTCQGQCHESVDDYIWWDKTHLTGGAHRIIANSILVSGSMEPSVTLPSPEVVDDMIQTPGSRFQSPHYKAKFNTGIIDKLVKEINTAKQDDKNPLTQDDDDLDELDEDDWMLRPLYIGALCTVMLCIGFVLYNKQQSKRRTSDGGSLAALSGLVNRNRDNGRGRFTPLRNMESSSTVV
ncbi:GDSL-like Lipase/Acylhydrolase-domain-containing protein [Halteromyces radiatus]|uniref:GDSL-like Lipase/Acylhydrolase-domain-containing protein n=1 Tax=Halteromyces radiatus TaxID=101107 RepID=UPI00222052C9|nr:GDSL-like Lipase/Acylhydrolase-domain-containing protein [Halteromyces radiatus]KAI8098474.1 GDSL-like Lipase/Acylhydrolase-domain-containing protein [Halteromyces radiatus]